MENLASISHAVLAAGYALSFSYINAFADKKMLCVMMSPTRSYLSNFKDAVDGVIGSPEFCQATQVTSEKKAKHWILFAISLDCLDSDKETGLCPVQQIFV